MKTIFPALAATILFFTACHKTYNGDSFPEASTEGKNTFGCYVDGQPFIAGSTLYGMVHPVNLSYYTQANAYTQAGFLSILGIDARYALDYAGNIVINKLHIMSTGTYNLIDMGNCANNYSCDGIFYRDAKNSRTFFAQSGTLEITRLDTVNKIIAGRFNFTAMDTLGNKKIISDGRFDAKYLQ